MRRYGCFAVLLLVVALLACCAGSALLPHKASALAVEVTPWPYDYLTPLPYPTQIPYPTACTAATPTPICGLATVQVAHTNGEAGYSLLTAIVALFGRVLPTFDDRLPLILCVDTVGSVVPSAHRRKAVGDGQQFVLPLRKCRMQIIECRQEPFGLTFIGVCVLIGHFVRH